MLLLVGGTGFLGRHIAETLAIARLPGVCLSRTPDLRFVESLRGGVTAVVAGSSAAADALAAAGMVIYLANQSRPGSNFHEPGRDIETNVTATANFFQQLLDVNPGCRAIFVSSGGQIYGRGHRQPIPETCPIAPPTPYALGKALTETMLQYYVRERGANITILRLANPVGHWQMMYRHGLVAAAVRAAKNDGELTIFGDGQNVRDYFDARDFAQLVVNLYKQDKTTTGVFNIGSGIGRTECDVIRLVQETLGEEVRYRCAPARPFDLSYAVLDSSAARQALPWEPQISLSDTIVALAEHSASAAGP